MSRLQKIPDPGGTQFYLALTSKYLSYLFLTVLGPLYGRIQRKNTERKFLSESFLKGWSKSLETKR